MTYAETLEYLYQQLPMFQRVGKAAFKKDLTNIIRLCDALGQPQESFPCVHIAGTNGKGSVTHMIGAVLQESGYKVGYYTSPHLIDFRERIKINGAYVTEAFVVAFTEKVKPLVPVIQPSFFEITVAMAFQYFAEESVDIAIIETGMGGRLDSTNIVHPLLSVITNVGFDHQQFLGDTLPDIAFEKAGIIKPGTPVVIGEYHPETAPTFTDMAFSRQAPILFAKDYVKIRLLAQQLSHIILSVSAPLPYDVDQLIIGTGALYQVKNVTTTIMALSQLMQRDVSIPKQALLNGLRHFADISAFTGRWQVLQSEGPMVLTDCAHNPQGMEQVMAQVLTLSFTQLHIVLGTVSDKKLKPLLAVLPPTAIYYFCTPDVPRGLAAPSLAKAAEQANLHGETYESVAAAYQAAINAAGPNDLVYIGGSIFVVANCLAFLQPSRN